jgi:hypothetical protein
MIKKWLWQSHVQKRVSVESFTHFEECKFGRGGCSSNNKPKEDDLSS